MAHWRCNSSRWRPDCILKSQLSAMKTKPKQSHQSAQSVDARWATELVRERMKESNAISHLGFDVERVEKGRAVFVLDVRAHHKQVHGVVHGGILAALADTTAAIAAYTVVPRGTEIATVELKINYLEPVPGGRIKADARVLRAGRNFVVSECEIWNEDKSLAAKALLTFGAAAGHSIQE
jgi:uncharacterized protein (TIGR00369 family)